MFDVTLNRQYKLHNQVQEEQHKCQVEEELEIAAPCQPSYVHVHDKLTRAIHMEYQIEVLGRKAC